MKSITIGPHVVDWVAKRTGEHGNYGAAVGIGLHDHGKLVAGVVFNEFNGANMCMHVASDESKRWMNRELLWFVFHYAFEQAKVKRLTGIVAESNKAAIEFDKHIGFSEEARLKDAHPDGDLIVMVMHRSDCRWLQRRNHVLKAA